ncbi:MAG: purine-binding chemotaxis protein CheW [Marinilabiliaceae bacterium]|nr:purine-binding chemotaxis protein CheW [Marinilabiliaceae bacterium]
MDKKNIESYLTFKLQNELFAVSVHKVLEIIETGEEHTITPLPKAPPTISGVVNFRGNVIPVVDTRKKFDFQDYLNGDKYVVIVLNLTINGSDHFIGALADKVVDVIEIDANLIKPVPEVGQGYNSEFIQGVVHYDNRFIMVLNLEAAMGTNEIITLKVDEASETETESHSLEQQEDVGVSSVEVEENEVVDGNE